MSGRGCNALSKCAVQSLRGAPEFERTRHATRVGPQGWDNDGHAKGCGEKGRDHGPGRTDTAKVQDERKAQPDIQRGPSKRDNRYEPVLTPRQKHLFSRNAPTIQGQAQNESRPKAISKRRAEDRLKEEDRGDGKR